MKESYREREALNSGPQSCIVARKGKDEALIGVQAGRDMELRNVENFGEPMRSRHAEGNSGRFAMARISHSLRSQRP
jgi:hypothetical protein